MEQEGGWEDETVAAPRRQLPAVAVQLSPSTELTIGGLKATIHGPSISTKIVELLESSEDDAQSTSCCVAILNACFQYIPAREQCLDCGGINALVTCLA